MKRKWGILALAVCALVGFLCTAHADQLAADVFDAVAALLTKTENVTLKGNATFSLNGEPFKYVETTYVQDGVNSEWVLNLASPREDGSLRQNGFTAVANDRYKYGMEVCKPGTYVGAEDDPQSVILRPSAQLAQLISLGHTILAQLPTLPEEAFSLSEENQLVIQIEEEQIPDSLSPLISLGVMMAIQRTMHVVDDSIAAPPYPDEAGTMADYVSPAQAIVHSTASYELVQLSADAKMDEEGRLTEVQGTARFILHTFLEGDHELHISYAGQITDYGSSTAPIFEAEEYGVVPEEGTWTPLDETGFVSEGEYETAIVKAREFFAKTGMNDLDEDTWHVWRDGSRRYGITVCKADGTALDMGLTMDYDLLYLQDEGGEWYSLDFDSSEAFTIPDDNEETRQEIVQKLRDYLQEVRPDLLERFSDQRFDWGKVDESGAYVYMVEQWPFIDDGNDISFVVQTYPEWRILYFACISNG